MNLYPLKFEPILKSLIWGGSEICPFKGITPPLNGIGESWEISGVKDNVSVVANGSHKGRNLEDLIAHYKEKLVGKKVFERFGSTFPLLIKFIDAQDNLSIQVHPNDALAKARHNSFGKTEMWYVINAKPDAFLYSGFEKQLNPDCYAQTVADNTFIDYLAKQPIKKGDVFFLPAGRVHAIGAGSFIAEIQQTSDITYRIYDYGRLDKDGNQRELHTQLAKDAIDFKVYSSYKTQYTPHTNEAVLVESCPYFTTNIINLNKSLTRDYSQTDSFVIYICTEGACNITDNNGNKLTIKRGESVLIPASAQTVKIETDESVNIIETFV
ncbi:mannose-6-phosphate isomerase [Dysgonomonas sp. PH5-45]|uniref:type I phosphomannose isomerase catalytic subunit n=1 Tax=unclassified Dysgonomonas TaxID=2630389 RepID=UPI00247594FB|nr:MULTISPECIES: type I phosphomannose isomerase catalytic subunit [unclassified Dysgonomonas]MDH6354328.1 mannose-6-phosphate isomerase [Dysgonomonas sp. PH5-45]MDH6387228.1 mannose-6-phosphate isomerase [Dysgonomonas sp. PH5-37]